MMIMQLETTVWGKNIKRPIPMARGAFYEAIPLLLTNTPEAPKAKALNTSVPRRTPPSRKTGIRPCAALTT